MIFEDYRFVLLEIATARVSGTPAALDAKVTECSSAGSWQKWPKKVKSAGFGLETQTFLAGKAHFFSMS